MSFRFRKSFKLAPGIRLNLGRSGVSTTFGGRGMSVSAGRRGTFLNLGIPGTGIHARSRLGGGGGSGAAGAGAGVLGCLGCGGIGVMLLFVIGLIGSLAEPPKPGRSDFTPLSTIDSEYGAPQQRETLYAHGEVNVRAGAGQSHAVVRTLSRGDRVAVGSADANGWAPAYGAGGSRIGFVYRASTRLRPTPPSARSESGRASEPRPTRGAPSGASARCRDGTYSYSRNRRGTCSHHGGVAVWL